MCVSCGCGRYEDSHDDERNVTVASLQRAADASNRTLQDVLQSTIEGCARMLASEPPTHQSAGQAVRERLRPD
jgi:hypothetical protein